jgi:hypothetical protein
MAWTKEIFLSGQGLFFCQEKDKVEKIRVPQMPGIASTAEEFLPSKETFCSVELIMSSNDDFCL